MFRAQALAHNYKTPNHWEFRVRVVVQAAWGVFQDAWVLQKAPFRLAAQNAS